MLTDQQSDAINIGLNTPTFDYLPEVTELQENGSQIDPDEYIAKFEQDAGIETSNAEDIGGIVVYFNINNQLVSVYDYENFRGVVFETPVE